MDMQGETLYACWEFAHLACLTILESSLLS